ncbi:ribosomal protein S5 domain 2-type protein [Thelonectria olida]|uniref:Small ribosomal subunit protein uS9m n=1 Tax=Thelonectria olida TaxID=1576542 RepID=A0A9P8W6R8_9HYPO|nr:ribosomal protein S5 domain 2-type protein [Thelonectria olida]
MTTLTNGLRQLRCSSQLARTQWRQPASIQTSVQFGIRSINTDSTNSTTTPDQAPVVAAKPVPLPFAGVKHARSVPLTASYFTREPQFNDLYIGIARLLTKYHHLPTLPPGEAPQAPWVKLNEMRSKLGEPVKASHFAKVLRVAKRLNLIEPSLFPKEVAAALEDFKRDINPFSNVPRVGVVDNHGRAIGVGKRKESTARAWVVEGTGEVFVNGKALSKAFGRVHDRESAIWALQATERLDKYNVWAQVEGGGLTGQAEALTLAVAKALIVHEPALKTALRKAGCITRDPRTVERKKHGHVKARKMPAWVKR